MKKYRTLKTLLVLGFALFTSLGLAACRDGDENAALTFEVQEEMSIGYYEYVEVPTVVAKDSNNNLYFPVCTVKSPSGEEVAVEDGKIFVLYEGDYTFEYALNYNGETLVKTTTAKSSDLTAPEFTAVPGEFSVFSGSAVTIPAVQYEDNKDTAEDITLQVAVSLDGETVAVENNTFTAGSYGEYVIEYTVTDKAGNSAELISSVFSLKKEEGEIAYFYEKGSVGLCQVTGRWGTLLEVSDAAAYPLSENGSALKITEAGGIGLASAMLGAPAVKDITGYEYLYIDVYNPQSEPVKFWINYIYDIPYIEIAPRQWTRVVAEKNSAGNNFDMLKYSGKISDAGDGSSDLFYPGDVEGLPNPTASDLTRVDVGMSEALNKSLYVGQMRAVTELPELPDGIVYATAPKATLLIDGAVKLNSVHKVAYEKQDLDGATLTITVSVNGGAPYAVTENEDFTFATEGEYVFTATAATGGETIFESVATVYCVNTGDEIVSFTNPNVVNLNGLEPYVSNSVYTHANTFGYDSDNVTRVNGDVNALSGIYVHNPSIKDVSGYKYLYIDVYAEQCDIDFTVNYQYGSPYVTVAQGSGWKRIVLENDGNGDFIMLNKDGNVGGGDTSKVFNGYVGDYVTNLAITDITDVKLTAVTDAGWRCFLIGTFAGCNELPELPANVTYANYTAN